MMRFPPVIAIPVLAAGLFIRSWFTEPVGAAHPAVFLAASAMIAVSGAAADRLFRTVLPPIQGGAGPLTMFLARLPFRVMSGGIAYSVTLLAAKKLFSFPVRDIPFDTVFYTGGILSVLYFGILAATTHLGRKVRHDPHGTA